MMSHIIWMIVGKIKAIIKIAKEMRRSSVVCITPAPSTLRTHIIKESTVKITNQKMLTVHQKIQLIFII